MIILRCNTVLLSGYHSMQLLCADSVVSPPVVFTLCGFHPPVVPTLCGDSVVSTLLLFPPCHGFHRLLFPPSPWFPPSVVSTLPVVSTLLSFPPSVVTPWFPPSHGFHPPVVSTLCGDSVVSTLLLFPPCRGFCPLLFPPFLWFPPSCRSHPLWWFCGFHPSVVSPLPWFPPSVVSTLCGDPVVSPHCDFQVTGGELLRNTSYLCGSQAGSDTTSLFLNSWFPALLAWILA